MPQTPGPYEIDRWHRFMAALLFNRAWELLDTRRAQGTEGSPEGDKEMLAAALASWLHWRQVGNPVNYAVSDWQVARVWAVLGEGARAEEHARASLEIAEARALGPFYVGYAYEALARAAAVAGDAAARDAWMEQARGQAADVADPEERALLEADLATV